MKKYCNSTQLIFRDEIFILLIISIMKLKSSLWIYVILSFGKSNFSLDRLQFFYSLDQNIDVKNLCLKKTFVSTYN